MDGVILFADDKVFEPSTSENSLYNKLSKEYPVLAVNSIELAVKAIKSIGSFSAIILDWEFKETIDEEEFTKNPTSLLDQSDLYSLVYIFSNRDISSTIQEKYKAKFKRRIVFGKKNISGSIGNIASSNYNKIKRNIATWQDRNKSQVVSLNWSNSINQSVQKIFSDLSKANTNWVFELYQTAGTEVHPGIEVVNMLQALLSEKLITNTLLLNSIKDLVENNAPIRETNENSLGQLFQRIYYTNLTSFSLEDVPIMTGDVFKLHSRKQEYGVIISPECDIKKIMHSPDQTFQLITFTKDDFDKFIIEKHKPANPNVLMGGSKRKEVKKIFNQPIDNLFFLPSFPYSKTTFNKASIIDFSSSVKYFSFKNISTKTRVCKINSPYIQQLRQKYLSYIGRVGVLPVPDGLRTLNLHHL